MPGGKNVPFGVVQIDIEPGASDGLIVQQSNYIAGRHIVGYYFILVHNHHILLYYQGRLGL